MDSRSKNSNQDEELNFDYYLKYNIPVEQVRSILKHKKMNEDKIEDTVNKLQEARDRVNKYARKFIDKLDQHYGFHDVPSIVKKAIKYANKHELSPPEKDAIIAMAVKGDVNNTFNPLNQMRYTEMSKFMGIEAPAGEVLNIQAKDHQSLAEIVKLFESSRIIHTDIKNQLTLYRDCAVEAITADYDKNRANLSIHIHPVIVALFLPKVDAIEKRMLYTNMGRIVIRRATPYINRHISVFDNVMNGEMEAEWALTWDIVNDPNSLAYFSDDTPITNMLKRFKIQIELWKNVLNLRQGRLYSLGGYESDDGITGLLRVLTQYDWAYFDSPDMANVHDEGSVLRKLLSVFSFRPTFAQITTLTQRSLMGQANYNALSRTTFLNIPIVNVRLPTLYQPSQNVQMSLKRALNQSDFFIEHKTLVPKNRSVMFTNDIIFFYANRRFQGISMANLNLRVAYTATPYQAWNIGQTSINNTSLDFEYDVTIGENTLNLRSIVTVYRPPVSADIVGGSSAIVIPSREGRKVDENFYYNPLLANYMTEVNGVYKSNRPITLISRKDDSEDRESVDELGSQYGTIFMYAK